MPDHPDDTAARLEALRPRLRRFFSSRGAASHADDLASDSILRVWSKMRDGVEIRDLQAYTLGVGRIRLLEHNNRPTLKFDDARDPDQIAVAGSSVDPNEAHDMGCLTLCLDRLPDAKRRLLLRFMGPTRPGDDDKNKARRQAMADELSITVDNLYTQKRRIYAELLDCAEDCMKEKRAS